MHLAQPFRKRLDGGYPVTRWGRFVMVLRPGSMRQSSHDVRDGVRRGESLACCRLPAWPLTAPYYAAAPATGR